MDKFNAREWVEAIESLKNPRFTDAAHWVEEELADCHDWHERFNLSHGVLPHSSILCGVGSHSFKETDSFIKSIGHFVANGWARHIYCVPTRERGRLDIRYEETGNDHLGVEMLPVENILAPTPKKRPKPSNRHRYSISYSTRIAVYLRDQFVCQLCGDSVLKFDNEMWEEGTAWAPVLDHVIPHSRGGRNKKDNLQTAHSWCNIIRNDRAEIDREILKLRVTNRQSAQQAAWMLFDDDIMEGWFDPVWANYDTSMFTAHELNWFMKAFEDKLSKLRAA